MVHIALAAATVLGITTVVLAQSDPVAARKELMGIAGQHGYVTLPKMIRGQEPYDQAKVDMAFTQLIDAAKKLVPLYPAGTEGATRPGSNYFASPRIWQNRTDFDARLAKYVDDLAAAKARATNLDGLKAGYVLVRQSCDSCHDDYRVRK